MKLPGVKAYHLRETRSTEEDGSFIAVSFTVVGQDGSGLLLVPGYPPTVSFHSQRELDRGWEKGLKALQRTARAHAEDRSLWDLVDRAYAGARSLPFGGRAQNAAYDEIHRVVALDDIAAARPVLERYAALAP